MAGNDGLSFQYILGICFIPFAYIIGVPAEDAQEVAQLIGVKTIINEFVAYQQLGELMSNCEISPRAATLATYALCGFANPASVGIELGVLGAMVPDRRDDFSKVILRAYVAGFMTNLLNACVAGCLIPTTNEACVY